MSTTTVSSKGQVTLHKDLLRHLGVAEGDRVEVNKLPGGRLEVRAARYGGIEEIFGLLAGKSRVRLSIDEINAAARVGWSGKR